MNSSSTAKNSRTGTVAQQRAEADLKTVLTSRGGQVSLQDLRSAWEKVHGSALSLPAYGMSNVMVLLDRCRSVCRLEKHGRQDVIKLNYSQTVVSNFVASVQLDLHRAGRAVSFATVINRTCDQLGVNKYSELGLGPPCHLPRLRRLSELESRLETYVTTYVANRMIATLFDLQSYICDIENVSDFASLQVGPLIQMHLVRSLFQVPAGQTEIVKVAVVDVVEALSSLMRRSNRDGYIQPSSIVDKVAMQHSVDALALGVRINGLGFYIKNLSEAKKKEHEAHDVLNRDKKKMQEAAMEALTGLKESLDLQQAQKLTALQQQHVEELQALQAIGNERRARFQNDLDTITESKPMRHTASPPAPHEHRKLGFTTAPGKTKDTQSWLTLSAHVKTMDDFTLNSLSAFSLAVAQQCYAAANVDTTSRVGHSLGQLERLDFWKTDVLAGLLMQAFMLATHGFNSSAQMLQRLSVIAAGIELNCAELPEGMMDVPGLSTASPGTEWLCIFWQFMHINVDSKYADPPDDGHATSPTASIAELKGAWCELFAPSQVAHAKALTKKQGKFWQQDCLASILFEALMSYVSSGQAALDIDAIQEWLCSHSKSSAQVQAAGPSAPITHTECQDTGGFVAAEPVDASTLHAAISELSHGFSIVQLSSLEDQLVKHFQVTKFADLGHGASLIQLLSRDSVALECMSGSIQGSAMAPLDKVLGVLGQAVQCTPAGVSSIQISGDHLVSLQQALCSHFRVSDVDNLGHGSMQRLMKLHAGHSAGSSSNIASLAALACTDISLAGRDNGMTVSKAMQQLQAAPQLADLEDWSQWAVACEPALGQLSTFLSQHGAEGKIEAVELPGGTFIKVDSRATPTHFLQAASAGNGQAAAAALVGQVVAAGGISRAPLILLASHAEAALQTLQPWSEPAAFVLEATSCIPATIRRSLAKQVFLEPFYKVVGSPDKAEAAVLAACKGDASAQVLYSLGIQLGISSWQQYWLQCCTQRISQNRRASEPLSYTADNNQGLSLPAEPAVATQTHGFESAPASVELESILQSLRSLTAAPQQSTDDKPVPQSCVTAVSDTLDASEANNEDEVTAVSDESLECQRFIEGIRQTEFGMGVELDASGAELRQKMNDRLGRALHRLSQDLYSKDVHFVLELVQNADDNTYDADAWPAVEFILKDTGITIVNNEVGFSEVNVKALCDVGKSTKQHKVGYIGQKGIGFKSVFKVTDTAEIHSKGFHISFDLVQHQALGYILPTWIGTTAQHATDAPRISSLQSAATRVVLPYKQELHSGADQLLHNFHDIQPTLLLFLQKLQCIAITDMTSHHRDSVILKKQLPHGVVELRHGAEAQHATKWLMVRQTVQPHSKRLDVVVESTELAMAFELCEEAPCQQQVFAFLPLRRYGLRFIIQANFIVPSSREAVDSNSAWNEELRGHLPDLFCKALASFRALPAQDGLLWVSRWLQSIPLQGEAEDFFAPLPQAITNCLRQAPCIATEDNDWVLPAEAVLCTDGSAAARQLLAHATLIGVPGAKYIHPDLTVLHSSALQSALGIKTLDLDHLLQVLHSAHAQGMIPALGAQWCGQMLACIFNMLAAKEPQLQSLRLQDMTHSASVQSVCQQLRSLPVFFLSSGAWSHADQPLFQSNSSLGGMGQSTNNAMSAQSDDRKQRRDSGHELEDVLDRCGLRVADMQLCVLAADFCVPGEASGSLSKMLQVLGMKSITFLDIIDRHILPAFNSDQACQLSPNVLVSYLAFISLSGLLSTSKFDAAPDTAQGKKLLKQLQQSAIIWTNRGAMKVANNEAIHFPVSLGSQYDICKHIPQHDFIMVSEHYAQSRALEPKSFRKLLFKLGITDCIQAQKQTVSLSHASKPTSPWAGVDLSDAAEDGWILQDHSSREFEAVVQSVLAAEDQTQLLPSMQYLAELLSVHWAAHVGHWLGATCVNKSTGQAITTHS